ncbi:hypothetical protein GORHZ_070_00280 [Gordonia rhizosphera NBRC 16068]|uniref:Uncharacterized protein n=1 Tax=Gordonia rhizosphera NBRC 16068 TaxID=1108045 RepID=K6V1H4_9ACTN|nr:hypothetical protein GORHZ_070_00280 [Gordonia rhizosphera NBRC 16068]
MTSIPLLGPVRVRFSGQPTAPVGGAWYPYSVQLADELPGVLLAARPLFGDVVRIGVNWHSFRRFPGLDSLDSPPTPPLMTLTTQQTSVTLLVIPPRTASSLAAILLRLASNSATATGLNHSLEYRRAERILQRARGNMPSTAGPAVHAHPSSAAERNHGLRGGTTRSDMIHRPTHDPSTAENGPTSPPTLT